MEPEIQIVGRDVILTCNGVKGRQYEELYIQTSGRGICGRYTPSSDKCEKPTTTTCGFDQDIIASCGRSASNTPYIKVTKRNLDAEDNVLWECFGTGSLPLWAFLTINAGEYM